METVAGGEALISVSSDTQKQTPHYFFVEQGEDNLFDLGSEGIPFAAVNAFVSASYRASQKINFRHPA